MRIPLRELVAAPESPWNDHADQHLAEVRSTALAEASDQELIGELARRGRWLIEQPGDVENRVRSALALASDEQLAAHFQENPTQMFALVRAVHVGTLWTTESDGSHIRWPVRIPDSEDTKRDQEPLAHVYLEEGRWCISLKDVVHDDDYDTEGEALAVADSILLEDGIGLEGGSRG